MKLFYVAFAILAFASPVSVFGQTEEVLYAFAGGVSGGAPYFGGVVFDNAGNLYGTANEGGRMDCGEPDGCGTVFQLMPDGLGGWAENRIHAFGAKGDGYDPITTLIIDGLGNLYGVTLEGGAYGYGTVYEVSPVEGDGWSEKVLYSFQGGADGSEPLSPLVFDPAGNLYGTTVQGGAYSPPTQGGTVFELAKGAGGTWSKSIIHSFGMGNDGVNPSGGLTFDTDGNLYGATVHGGGTGKDGIIFQLTPASGGVWTEHLLHAFGGTGDGNEPVGGLVFDSKGNLYGAASGGEKGGGVVFELSPASGGKWKESILHPFGAIQDGVSPGNLIIDSAGNLYGETFEGGIGGCIRGGCGVVYELSPAPGGTWKETILMDASASTDGGVPWGGLIFDESGNLYGTTYGGSGTAAYWGTVFEVVR